MAGPALEPIGPRRRGGLILLMDASLRALLDELHSAGRAHDAGLDDRRARLRNLEPETAELIWVLVQATAAREVLELGTSNGYSTLWLADAARAVGGRVVSVDIDPERSAQAHANLERTGLADRVELRVQDAGDALAEIAPGGVDLLFLDAERPAYVGYWPHVRRVLRPGGLLAVDNAVSHAHELTAFTALIEALPRVATTLLRIGAGLRLAVGDFAGPCTTEPP